MTDPVPYGAFSRDDATEIIRQAPGRIYVRCYVRPGFLSDEIFRVNKDDAIAAIDRQTEVYLYQKAGHVFIGARL